MTTRSWTVAIVALLLAGCTSSVYPLASPETRTRDLDLAGVWVRQVKEGAPGPAKFVLDKGGEEPANDSYFGYAGPREFDVEIAKIGKSYYVDLRAYEEDSNEHEGGFPTLQLPLHVFARIELEGDQARIYPIKDDKFNAYCRQRGANYIEHEHGFPVITEPTARLQQFVREGGPDLFFPEPIVYVRKTRVIPRLATARP